MNNSADGARPEVPAGLGIRGMEVWEGLAGGDRVRNALALEAARCADRLDELDNIIQGKGVLNLMQFRILDHAVEDDGSHSINVEVKFNNVLGEARQQQTAFATLLKTLAAGTSAADAPPAAKPAGPTPLDRVLGQGLKKA